MRNSHHSLSKRIACVDELRIIGSIGIVWFHAMLPGAGIGHAGLLVFIIFAVVFAPSGVAWRDAGSVIGKRSRRILIPWILWCAIYAALRITSSIVSEEPPLGWIQINMLLYGTWTHLWFLPYIFSVNSVMILWTAGESFIAVRRGAMACLAIAILLPTCFMHSTQFSSLGAPFGEWVYAAPALGFGLLLWLVRRSRSYACIFFMAGLILFCLGVFRCSDGRIWQVGIGVTVAVFPFVLIKSTENTMVEYLGKLSMGVYLVHPIFLAMLFEPFELHHIGLQVVAVTVVIIMSFGASALMNIYCPILLGGLVRKHEV